MNPTSEEMSAHLTPSTLMQPAIQAWKIYLRDQGRSNHTLKAFIADLQLLAGFLPTDAQIGSVGTKDLENYLSWLENERNVPCSPKTLSRRITSIKSFFRWLSRGGVIPFDPAEKVEQKTVISPLPVVLTKSEQERVIEAADALRTAAASDLRPYLLLKLVLETAMKKGECLNLKTNHVELDGPEGPFVFIRYSSPRYRYKERKVPVSAEWAQAFQEYAAAYQIQDAVFPWSQRLLEYLLEGVGNAAQLDKHLSFAMCRWTSALNDLTAGADPDKIRQKLGISKIQWREISQKLQSLAKEYGYEPAAPENQE